MSESSPETRYAHLALRPARQETVVTTTTTSTVHFQPLRIPKPANVSVIEDDEDLHLHSHLQERAFGKNKVNARLYPLARARPPSALDNFKLTLGSHTATYVEVDPEQQQPQASSSTRGTVFSTDKAKSKTCYTELDSQDVSLQESGRGQATRARVDVTPGKRKQPAGDRPPKMNHAAGHLATPLTLNGNNTRPRKKSRHDPALTGVGFQLPSPLASPVLKPTSPEDDQGYSHVQTQTTTQMTGLPASPAATAIHDTTDDDDSQRADQEVLAVSQSQDFGSGLELATLMSLPTLVDQFGALSNDLQAHVLFNLLKRSPIPVLQLVSSVITPALKRDFIQDLPAELSALILSFVDGPSLCRATRVSKKWHKLIDGDGRIWKQRMMREGHWIGDGSEQAEAISIETGVKPLSNKELLLKRWMDGVWDIDFDPRLAARPASRKVHSARLQVPGSPEDVFMAPHRRVLEEMIDPDAQGTPKTPVPGELQVMSGNRLQTISLRKSTLASSHYVHPYKLIYRKRFLSRRNWTRREPLRMSFQGHGNSVVTCLQFDRQRILSASDDHSINVYSMRRGGLVAQLQGHEGGVWALEYLGDVLVSGSTDRTLRVWDVARQRCSHIFVGHTSTVRCLQIIEPVNVNPDPDGPPVWEPPYPLIVSGSRDWTLRVWKLPMPNVDPDYVPSGSLTPGTDASPSRYGGVSDNPYHLRVLAGHKDAVRAIHGSGRIVVSGSYDNTVRVWDILNGECLQVLRGHTEKVYSVVYDRARAQCASGSMDGTVKLWSTTTGECLRSLDGHTSLVGLLGISQNHLVSAAADSTLRVWDAATGKCRHVLAAHAGAITCFQHDDHKVVSGSDGTLKMWNIEDGSYIRDLLVNLSGVWQVAFDERFCVAAVQRNGQSEYDILDFGNTDGEDGMSFDDNAVLQRPEPYTSSSPSRSQTYGTRRPPAHHAPNDSPSRRVAANRAQIHALPADAVMARRLGTFANASAHANTNRDQSTRPGQNSGEQSEEEEAADTSVEQSVGEWDLGWESEEGSRSEIEM